MTGGGKRGNGDRIPGKHSRGSGLWSGLSNELSRFRKCGEGRERNVKEALKV